MRKFPAKLSKDELSKVAEHLKTFGHIVLRQISDNEMANFVNTIDKTMYHNEGYWSSAALSYEGSAPGGDKDFYFIFSSIEAEKDIYGVHYTDLKGYLKEADGVAILVPKNFGVDEWAKAIKDAKEQVGKPYDLLFNHKESSKYTCIELVVHALKAAVPDFAKAFPKLNEVCENNKFLTPQMLYDTQEFSVILEIRHK